MGQDSISKDTSRNFLSGYEIKLLHKKETCIVLCFPYLSIFVLHCIISNICLFQTSVCKTSFNDVLNHNDIHLRLVILAIFSINLELFNEI